MKISASIVVYKNSTSMLSKLVNSLRNSSVKIDIHIIDNSPKDTLRSFFATLNVEYIFNNANLGYGSAHNIAMKKSIKSCADYHIVLNPDIVFQSDVIESLKNYMDLNHDVGLVMPRVFYPDSQEQRLCKLLPTPKDLLYRRFMPFKSMRDKINDTYELKFADFNTKMNIPFLSGSFMFLRVSALKEVGLFDENIFMYLEDTDLSRRIHSIYKTMYYPNVSITHEFEKASYKNFNLLLRHIQSSIYYFNKWGWFIDSERDEINNKILDILRDKTKEENMLL